MSSGKEPESVWQEYIATCITCRRLRKRAGTLIDHPAVVAAGRDYQDVLEHARRHEAFYDARDEAHCIEIGVFRATLQLVKTISLKDAPSSAP